jgi:hypothetical protein
VKRYTEAVLAQMSDRCPSYVPSVSVQSDIEKVAEKSRIRVGITVFGLLSSGRFQRLLDVVPTFYVLPHPVSPSADPGGLREATLVNPPTQRLQFDVQPIGYPLRCPQVGVGHESPHVA